MNPTREEAFFALALTKPAAERAAWLDRECGEDKALRQRLDTLLAEHGEPETELAPEAAAAKPGFKLDLDDAPDEAVGQTLGRYKLLEKVGEGGCGVVYVADQTEPVRRRVALKVIKLGMDTKQVVARFEAERQALAMMDHPNIAKVLDAGTTSAGGGAGSQIGEGRPYFVMELVRGIRITDYCDKNNLPTKERLDLFIRVCQAIQHAHQKGIIHRDIKPSNILVTLHDGLPVPKVIDFGIAKATEGRLTDATVYTQLNQFIGTPAYMSPEQAEMSGLDIDTRSDIYSLGVLLYELLVGKTPFDSKQLLEAGLDEMRRTIREREPLRPSTRLGNMEAEEKTTTAKRRGADAPRLITILRGDLDWIVMKCLEKDRTRRYETANGLAMDIKRHLQHEPVVARPPSAGYRVRKAWQRNKLAVSAAAMVAIALVIGGTVSLWQGAMAQRARKAEERQRIAAEAARGQAISSAQTAEHQKAIAEENFRQAEKAKRLAEQREEDMLRRAYAADINLAHQATKNNNLGRALDLLQRYYPQPGKPDLRGWEWRYLWALCRSDAEFELCRFEDSVCSAVMSPDGQWVALGGDRGTGVRVWDVSKRREVAKLAVGEEFCHASFSPDGRLLAFTSTTFLRLWDCIARETVAETRTDKIVVSVGFSGDGQRIVTFSVDDAITIWDTKDLRKLQSQKVPEGQAWLGSPFAFSPDLKVAVRVEGWYSIVAVDLETRKERWRVKSDAGFSYAIAISPDGKWVVSGFGTADGKIHVFEMSTGKEVAILPGHGAWISALVFWPDGSKLASASADQTIRIWDMQTFQPLRVLQGHRLEVWSLALSRDGERLISGSKDGSVLVWNADKDPGERNHWRIPGRHHSWAFSSDGDGMITVDVAGSRVVKLTGPKFSNVEALPEIGRGDPAFCDSSSYLFSPSVRRLAVLSTNGMLSVWNLEERRRIQEFPTATDRGDLVTFSGDESKIWLRKRNSSDSDLVEWDLGNRHLLRSVPGVRWPFQITADKWVFAAGGPNAGMFQDLSSGKIYRPMMFSPRLSALFGNPTSSPDDTLLVLCHDAGLLTVWKTEDLVSNTDPKPIRTLGGILMSFWSCGFSADGSRLFGCSHGAEAIKIWDTASYNELLTLAADADNFSPPQLSLDGQYLVASAGDQIFVWRAASWNEIKQAEVLEKDR